MIDAAVKADKDDPVVLRQADSMKEYFQRDFGGALTLIKQSLSIDPQ